MRRTVYRSPVQATVLCIVFGGFFLLSVVAAGNVVPDRDVFGIVLYLCIGIMGIYGFWRATRLGVVVESAGIRIRGMGRDKVIPWSSIEKVTAEESDNRFGARIYGPVISVAGEPDPMPITPMGSYRRSDAQARADQLAGHARAASQASPN